MSVLSQNNYFLSPRPDYFGRKIVGGLNDLNREVGLVIRIISLVKFGLGSCHVMNNYFRHAQGIF